MEPSSKIFYPEKDSTFYKNPLPIYDASLNKTNNKLVITDNNSIKIIDLNNEKKQISKLKMIL